MATQKFLQLVLPDNGIKVIALATPTKNGGAWFKYKTYDNIDEAAAAATVFDDEGETVYFAVNSFNDWYLDEAKDKKRIRTQENVHSCRSLFDDFDVGSDDPKKYETRNEALADIIRLATVLKLTPTITSSGGGYHCYFSLDQDVDKKTWEQLSALKRDVTNHLGIKADRAVDLDSARILRPVGTHNRKTNPPKAVELVKEGKQYPINVIRGKLEKYIKENNVKPAPASKRKAIANPFAAALGDYPTADAEVVAEHCFAIREFRDKQGDIPEPHWHRAIGVVKHCDNGEQIIHDWSKGYKGYNK
jgi:hypothetical protein